MEVPRTPTPLTPELTARAFLHAWDEVFDGEPSRNQAEWLLAFLWNENRRGQAIIQHNWGNLSTNNFTLPYWRPPWYRLEEIEAMSEPQRSRYLDIHEKMLAGQEPEAFRAFPDHKTGARVWLERLRDRFPTILQASLKNSAVAMQDAIFESGYCASPLCKTNAARYAELRHDIREQGLLAELGKSSSSKKSRGGGFGLFLGMAAALGLAWVVKATR